MALTIRQLSRDNAHSELPDGTRRRVVEITFDNSYATGGEAISAGDLVALTDAQPPSGAAWSVLDIVRFDAEAGQAGHHVALDRANQKLKAFNGTTEIANATDLSALVVRATVEYAMGAR